MNRQQKRPPYQRPPAPVPAAKMGQRELAWGMLIALKYRHVLGERWDVGKVVFSYDQETDTVVAALKGVGETWSRVAMDFDATMAEIERRFGKNDAALVREMTTGC